MVSSNLLRTDARIRLYDSPFALQENNGFYRGGIPAVRVTAANEHNVNGAMERGKRKEVEVEGVV